MVKDSSHGVGLWLLFVAVICSGCQSLAPGGLGGLTASRDERQIVKLAQNDPFPSPADVGLGETTSVR